MIDKRKKKLIAEVAEGFRALDPSDSTVDKRTQNLVLECKHQEETCLYMATTIFEWSKSVRMWRAAFVIFPILFAGLAILPLLSNPYNMEWFTGLFAMLAGLSHAIYKALDFDLVSLDTLCKYAHQFKALQDRFHQSWCVTALGSFDEFQSEFAALMNSMDAVRAESPSPPERFFIKAQKKISIEHYKLGVDQPEEIS